MEDVITIIANQLDVHRIAHYDGISAAHLNQRALQRTACRAVRAHGGYMALSAAPRRTTGRRYAEGRI
jgi:hypothetical protein